MTQSDNRPTTTQIRLQEAVNKLAQYFGLYTARDLAGQIALSRVLGTTNDTSFDLPPPPQEVAEIIRLLIDTSSGGHTVIDTINQINNLMTQASNDPQLANSDTNGSDVQTRINQLIKIYYGSGNSNDNNNVNSTVELKQGVLKGSSNLADESIANMIGDGNFINSNLANPNRFRSPGLSVILQNNVRVTPAHKNTNACVIFLNSIPTIELARAVPFLDFQFQFGRPPTDSNDRIQNASIFKFLLGAAQAPGSTGGSSGANSGQGNNTTRLLLDANTLQATGSNNEVQTYSIAGMEMFTAPQTLVNADELDDPLIRSTPVLDKFRPFMTFKDFTIEVRPTTGIMCFKTAKMDFVLHDRSRLSEIADFVRPDLYSNTEILVEYGWSHPDGPLANNPYADLINGMRCREKYGIVNVHFQMDDQGQINVSMDLAMRGATDMHTENIASNEDGVGVILRQIATLSQTVGELRRRTFQQGAPGAREVRGIQILDAASDASGQFLLSSELRSALRDFRNAMNQATTGVQNANIQQIQQALDNLYGPRNQNGAGGQIANLRGTMRRNIEQKLSRVGHGPDPFAISSARPGIPEGRFNGRRAISNPAQNRNVDNDFRRLGIPDAVSLGKLLLTFVGEPLARTGKFDDVQLIFYPFNQYAGFANSLNVANFPVDTRFFLQQYEQYRMENASRAANMSLRDFLVFIAQTIVDDPAASAYGLWDTNSGRPFYRRVVDRATGNETTETAQNIPDSAALQARIETRLRSRTPDGSFRMPQVDFYIETLPKSRFDREDGQTDVDADSYTILRVHIFDRQTTSYETQQALLASNRDEELRTISGFPTRNDGDPGVRQSQEEQAATILQAAQNTQLIEAIPNSSPTMYRIRGGPRRLKEFLMKTSPYIIYGTGGTAVMQAGVTTIQDPSLSTVNLLRSFQAGPLEPNGESPGGLPLQVIPAEMSMQTFGCPLLEFAQQFFVDFQTGTTLDNYYTITGLSHKFEQGNFTTNIKFSFSDAYGRYSSFIDRVRAASDILNDIQSNNSQQNAQQGGSGQSPPSNTSAQRT